MTDTTYRIGVSPDLCCRPLIYGLEHSKSPAKAGLFVEAASVATQTILNNECDAAFIGPVDYARNSSDFSLYASGAVSSRGDSRTVLLCMNRDIRKIATVAVGPVSSSDIVLTKIVLTEKFGQEITIVPFIGSVEQMLKKADAALLSGDAVLTAGWNGSKLDIVDEWSDMTELPFVHLACATRKERFNGELDQLLRSSQEKGASSPDAVAASASKILALPAELLEDQLDRYSYGFDTDARQALSEFFRYAYYHGILPDVPEIEIAPSDPATAG